MSDPDPVREEATHAQPPRNRFDRMEWAGAFGDLGTLIPFVVAYLGVLGLPPFGVLFSFGLGMVVCGIVYRTPFPVQPMKAIGAVAATQAAQTLHDQTSRRTARNTLSAIARCRPPTSHTRWAADSGTTSITLVPALT